MNAFNYLASGMEEWKHISEGFVAKFMLYSLRNREAQPFFDCNSPALFITEKLIVLRYSKDPTTLELLTTTEADKLMLPFRQ